MKTNYITTIFIITLSFKGFSQTGLGIGTTSPTDALDIETNDATKTSLDLNNTSTGDPIIHFQVSSTTDFTVGVDNSDADKFKIGTTAVDATNALTIDGSGNVGFGTESPGTLLDADGTAIFNESGNAVDFRVESNSNTHGFFVDGSEDKIGLFTSSPGFTLEVFNEGVEIENGVASYGVHFLNYNGYTTDYSAMALKNWGVGHVGYRWNGVAFELCDAGAGNDPDGWTSIMNFDVINTRMGITDLTPDYALDVEASSATVASFNRTSDDGTIISFQQDGTEEGTISVTGNTVDYNAFTGAHFAKSEDLLERGQLVSFNGKNEHFHNNSNSEIIYGTKLSQTENDPKIAGAHLGILHPNKTIDLDNPIKIMAVGNGDVWVSNTGGNIKVGDNLISSSIPGCAQKDNGSHDVSYVFAKATEAVDWENIKADKDGIKRKKIIVYFESFQVNNLDKKVQNLKNEIQQLEVLISGMKTIISDRNKNETALK